MYLNDRSTDDVPTGASDLGDMAVFVRDRSGRTKNHVVDRSPPEHSLLINRGLLGHQLLCADNIERVTLRHTVHWRSKLSNAASICGRQAVFNNAYPQLEQSLEMRRWLVEYQSVTVNEEYSPA
jgi:hypothetical protein